MVGVFKVNRVVGEAELGGFKSVGYIKTGTKRRLGE